MNATNGDGPTIDLTMDDDDEATPSDFVDYYQILGVGKAVSGEDLKKAYRKQALRWHPDKNPDSKEHAEVQFKLVAEAYEILSDPEKRTVYDKYGKEGLTKQKSGSTRSNSRNEDPFASFFRQSSHGHPFSRRGHFSFFMDPFEMFRQFFGSSDPFGIHDDDNDTFGFGNGFMGPSIFQHHLSLFNRPSLFSPFGTSPFHAIDDHASHSGSAFRSGNGRSVSTSISIVNGKTTKTTRIVENGIETVTIEENGVETSRRVNGVPVAAPQRQEALPSSSSNANRSNSRPQQIPSARVIPTSFSTGHPQTHISNHHHHHHHYTHSHPTAHGHHPSVVHRSHVHQVNPSSSSAHQTRHHHQQQTRVPYSSHSGFAQQSRHQQPQPQRQSGQKAPTFSHINHFTINPSMR